MAATKHYNRVCGSSSENRLPKTHSIMVSQNLDTIPTFKQLFNRLSSIPVGFSQDSNDQSCLQFNLLSHAAQDATEPAGLFGCVDGTFFGTSIVQKNTPNPFAWTTCKGDNQFAIRTDWDKPKKNGLVTITTSICGGSQEDFENDELWNDPESNATVIRIECQVLGTIVKVIGSEVLKNGFNTIGAAIPSFAQPNVLADGLGRIYSTSDWLPKLLKVSDDQAPGAFWDSWGDAVATAFTVTGGIVGGIIGAPVAGVGAVPTAMAGAATGASIGNFIGDFFR